MLRAGVRQAIAVVTSMKHADGSPVVITESPPGGIPVLTATSCDADIDERMKSRLQIFYHPGRGCGLGDVVDAVCGVTGVHGLRVTDASIMPGPVGAHYQVAVYAIAEQAARMVIE